MGNWNRDRIMKIAKKRREDGLESEVVQLRKQLELMETDHKLEKAQHKITKTELSVYKRKETIANKKRAKKK